MSKPKTLGQRIRSAMSSLAGKPRLDAAEPAKRVAAVEGLAAGEQDAFATVFLGDADREVRLAALARLTKLETLLEGLADADVAAAATQRLLALIDEGTPSAIASHPALRRAALVYAQSATDALRAAENIEDARDRALALLDNGRAEQRLAVARETWAPTALGEIEKAARDRDKAVHRLARERLANYRAASASRNREDEQTEKLLRAATALADDDAHYDTRREIIERDWRGHLDALAATDAELGRFGVVARDLEAIRGRLPPRRPAPKAAPAQVGEDFEALLAEAATLRDAVLAALAGAGEDADANAAFEQQAGALAARWNASADTSPPADPLSERFRAAMAAIADACGARERAKRLAAETERLLAKPLPEPAAANTVEQVRKDLRSQSRAVKRLLERYAWPDGLPLPAGAQALEERQDALANAERQCAAAAEALAEQVAAGIAKMEAAVAAGAAQDALELDRQLRELAKQLPPDATRRFAAELAALGTRVRELRSWRTFAEAPKREALCAQMEELAANALEIHEQAEAVKGLRKQWNALGSVDSRPDRELLKRFDRAAEQAFEPCRTHFKAQAERRKFNLEQRQAIVAALAAYLEDNDWARADWRGAERVLRQARAEWRQYHPMDRKAGRSLETRFNKLASDLHGKLKEAWGHHLERKEKIVEEAKAIRESGQTATEKADAMKDLQRQWKAAGPVPHRHDQRLWKLFRTECDAVFEARDTVRDRHADRRRAIEDAEALLAELERRVDIDPALDRDTVADYESRLPAFDALPKELRRRAQNILQHADRAAVDRQAANAAREAAHS